jgi:hypothetical protein
MRRSLVERLERRKEMMIAAFWANSGFEGREGAEARSEAISELEEHYDEAAKHIWAGTTPEDEGDEIDTVNNPFFSAMQRGVDRIQKPRNDEGTVREAIPLADLDTDQV